MYLNDSARRESGLPGALLGLWLFEPAAPRDDPVRRRRGRWLAGMALALLAILFAVGLMRPPQMQGSGWLITQVVAFIALPIIYVLARVGLVRAGAALLLSVWPMLAVVNFLLDTTPGRAASLAYLVPGVIASTIFLRPWGVAAYGVALSLGVLLIPTFDPTFNVQGGSHLVLVGAGLASVILLAVSLHYRNGVEHDRVQELEGALDGIIDAWSRGVEVRSGIPEGHARRVAALTALLGRACGLKGEGLHAAYRGALLHDIGMLGVPEAIVLKGDKRTAEDERTMRSHTQVAATLLQSSPHLGAALTIPSQHHEWWDGTGYPSGLRGEAIPLAARVFAVTHAWDALLIEDAHSGASTRTQAIETLKQRSGTQFDPEVVNCFLKIVE